MNDRPELKKVVFSYTPTDSLVEAVQGALPGATVVCAKGEELHGEIGDAQLVIGGKIPEETLGEASELVWQHVTYAGVEGVITPTLVECGVMLTNSSGVSAPNMAEHVIAMMLYFGRALPFFMKAQQERQWWSWEERPAFFELTGQTVLLLGTGAIGRATADRLRPFGCTIIGARRMAADVEGFDRVVTFNDLAQVLPEADHVVSSLPLTSSTRGLFSAELIGTMKPGSYFFNVGRGGTVDQDALVAALQAGRIAGAGLDVVDPEPLPGDSPVWGMPNVLMTSHSSGGSPTVSERVEALLLENLRRYQAGEDLLNQVDLAHGY